MAQDAAPPESLVLGGFAGIKNTVSPERLTQAELETAVNVDLDDAGQIRRRRGYTQVATGNYHSLKAIAGQTLVVKDGVLGWLGTDYTFTALTEVGPDRVVSTAIGETIYFCSRSVSGKIVGGLVEPWGVRGGDGTWLSPVMTPTDTLGEVGGKLLGAPPLATEIEQYRGRIYLAAGKLLWATELYLYDYIDKTRGFYQFEHDITLVAAVEDGIYVGTEGGLYFLAGTHAEGMARTKAGSFSVIRGSGVIVPASKTHPQNMESPIKESEGVMMLTAEGVCVGYDGGEVYNLTRGKVVFPGVSSAAVLYREDSGANNYVAVTDSSGGPAANARIGDYVDAEIRRFRGG